jgi:cobalt/nickel transport system permease protein
MSKIVETLYNLRLLDDLGGKETAIHKLHPLVKLLTTVAYLTVVVSFGRYEISSLLPFVFYPVMTFAFAELPVAPILKRLLPVAPLIIGIGIFNPLFDRAAVILPGGIAVARGWVTFLSILIKCGLTVTVGLLLIATTGIDRLAAALRMLKVPKLFVLQLLLTYRYLTVLGEELARMMRAYSLRAPGHQGIHRSLWGSFAGQLILRTFDRAQRVYEAMNLRGFTGEYHTGDLVKPGFRDFVYLCGWSLFFMIARIYNLPMLIGSLLTGELN